MTQFVADRRDIDFVLHEQLNIENLGQHTKFAGFNKKITSMLVSEARNLAIKEFLPTRETSDREGCQFENGKVTVSESLHRIYKLFNEGEWIGMTNDPGIGGQGMPRTVSLAAEEYFTGANSAFMMYPVMGHGTGKLIETFGTDKQKELFLDKLYSGKWGGTMLLTEPEAGSDVGALTTTATKNSDGTYSIVGNKIFISGGEHDLTENIIHPVLARIEGAPPGTKGISLLLVPKIWVNDDGSLGEFNDVLCTGIEDKLGIHGNATCSLSLGTKGKCRGTLLGEENKGMLAMFQLMNEARLFVGLMSVSLASASYLYAVNFARERVQGKNLLQKADNQAPSVPIIRHPDVRRQLMNMKAYVEGMRSLVYFTGLCFDRVATTDTLDEKIKYQGLIELLTPIVKGYVSDRAFEICSHGIQVHGGYGYIKEYPVEQLFRDCRITMIYEGTNGIQAMDLLGRKLGLNKGKSIEDLFDEIHQTIATAKNISALERMVDKVEEAVSRLKEVVEHMKKTAFSTKALEAFAFAHPFMEVTGDVIVAWMLLWRAAIAAPKLEKLVGSTHKEAKHTIIEKNEDAAFYEGQLKTAEFFFNSILPITLGKMNAVAATNGAVIEIPEASFGG